MSPPHDLLEDQHVFFAAEVPAQLGPAPLSRGGWDTRGWPRCCPPTCRAPGRPQGCRSSPASLLVLSRG